MRRLIFRTFPVLLLLAFFLPACGGGTLGSQTGETAISVSGTLKSSNGTPLPDELVSVLDESSPDGFVSDTTDENGVYALEVNKPEGVDEVMIQARGAVVKVSGVASIPDVAGFIVELVSDAEGELSVGEVSVVQAPTLDSAAGGETPGSSQVMESVPEVEVSQGGSTTSSSGNSSGSSSASSGQTQPPAPVPEVEPLAPVVPIAPLPPEPPEGSTGGGSGSGGSGPALLPPAPTAPTLGETSVGSEPPEGEAPGDSTDSETGGEGEENYLGDGGGVEPLVSTGGSGGGVGDVGSTTVGNGGTAPLGGF